MTSSYTPPSKLTSPARSLSPDCLRAQWHDRQESALEWRIGRANLPEQWSLETYPYVRQPGVNRKQIRGFAELDFIAKHENLVFVGKTGVGKTGLACGLLRSTQNRKNMRMKVSRRAAVLGFTFDHKALCCDRRSVVMSEIRVADLSSQKVCMRSRSSLKASTVFFGRLRDLASPRYLSSATDNVMASGESPFSPFSHLLQASAASTFFEALGHLDILKLSLIHRSSWPSTQIGQTQSLCFRSYLAHLFLQPFRCLRYSWSGMTSLYCLQLHPYCTPNGESLQVAEHRQQNLSARYYHSR